MKWGKLALIIFGAVVVTTLGIDAADTISGNQGTLLGQLVGSESASVCPSGMVQMSAPTTFTCVDKYEAAPAKECAGNPKNNLDTKEMLKKSECGAVSVEGSEVWAYITREQAVTACARSGKRLPSAAEWYQFSVGTPDEKSACNITTSAPRATGNGKSCVSSNAVEDTIGNVWEWTTDDVFDGEFAGHTLPAEGYVTQVDGAGVAVSTEEKDLNEFNHDYFWAKPEGVFAIMRGGFYASQEDAGIYSVHAATDPNFAGVAIGFRCVK